MMMVFDVVVQVDEFLSEVVRPLLHTHAALLTEDAASLKAAVTV